MDVSRVKALAAAYEALCIKRGIAYARLTADEKETLAVVIGLFGDPTESPETQLKTYTQREGAWFHLAPDDKLLIGKPDPELGRDDFCAEVRRLREEKRARQQEKRALLQQKNRAVNTKTVAYDAAADAAYLKLAFEEARRAQKLGEVPVGAVIVRDGVILARAHNRVLTDHNPTAHAEMLAIAEACRLVSNERLTGATLYVTLEPCTMCAGAIAHARIARVVWGTDDVRFGAMAGVMDVARAMKLNHRAAHTCLKHAPSREILQQFFQNKRQKKGH